MTISLATRLRRVTRLMDEIEEALDDADTVWDDLRDDDAESLIARRPGA